MAAAYRDELTRPRGARRTVLVGPADEFMPEHKQQFVHAETLGDAERHLRGALAAHGIAIGQR
jgi:hypothetical protein